MEPPRGPSLPRPFGEYTLIRELGRGAMGVVFEAVHRSLGRKVALKVLRTGFDTDDVARQRFKREARSCAQVRHDHIVEVYDAGEVEGQPFYSMALLEGRSLHDVARSADAPSPRELAAGIADIADALDALHRAGIVHRDVKPSNIMVAPGGPMVLADFGLARASSERLTATGQALGTPLYMSPEQVMGRTSEVDGRSDVYGLGATLYEALTGHALFESDEVVGILRMILKERPVPPSQVRPGIDRALERVVLKAVEKRKEDRYQSAGAMRDDLRAYAAGGEVVGRPVSSVRHGIRIAVPWWPAAAAAVVVAAAGAWAWTHRSATLSVTSHPPAALTVDGDAHGTTPFDGPVPPGEHRLALRSEGFRDLVKVVRLDPGAEFSFEPSLVPLDPEDPKALAALAREFDVAMVDVEPAGRTRGDGGVSTALPLLPRGLVRPEDLTEWSVETGPEFDGAGGRLEFASGGKTIATLPFQPATTGVSTGPLPAEAAAAFQSGAEVEWGWHPAKGKPVTTVIRPAPKDIDAKIAHIDRRFADQPLVRCHLVAQCYLNAGLDVAAYREAAAFVSEHRASERGWAVMVQALREMGLEKSELFAHAREGLASVPAAERGRAVRNR
jgi:predicted Ser/Thr protein kinase